LSIVSEVETSAHEAAPAAAIVPALPGVEPQRLAAAFAHCRLVTRARARNFYYGLRLTPEPRRSAIFAIYAWMREADDVVDDAPAGQAHRELARFRSRTELALHAQSQQLASLPPFWTAFAATFASYPLDRTIFDDVLNGLDEDLDHAGYNTDDELSLYCYRVASTAGLACMSIWGLRPGAEPDQARDLAIRRGQAFQRTNILRDFSQDFDAAPQRIYLPREAFKRHGLTPDDVRSWRRPAACRAFVIEQAARARAEYDASAGLESMIDPECAPTLWAMTRIYSALLEVIERDPQRVVAMRRIRVAAPRKAFIALRAAWRSRRSGW
jgi:15-cis-phytoene synthase